MLRSQPITRVLIGLAATICFCICSSSASAGTYVANACLASASGELMFWSHTETAGTTGGIPYFYNALNCTPGGFGIVRRFETNGLPGGAANDWDFIAPSGTSLSKVSLDQYAVPRAAGSFAGVWAKLDDGTSSMVASAFGGSGGVLTDATYDFPSLGSKTVGFSTKLGCVDEVVSCAGMVGADYGAEYLLKGARITLIDSAKPRINSVSGAGWTSTPTDGVHPFSYSVGDVGSGVTSTEFLVDGIVYATNNATCENLGSPRPCPTNDQGSFSFDTTRLSEGAHQLTVRSTDAASNTTDTQLGVTIRRAPQTSSNSPVSVSNPAWDGAGAPAVGDALHGSPGSWSGTVDSLAYQWLRCDSAGANCVAIPGATSPDYSATGSDVGHALVLCVTATNSGGATTSCSAPTAPVVSSHPGSTVGAGSSGAGGPTASAGVAPEGNRGAPNGTPASDAASLTAFVNTRVRNQRVRFGKRVPLAGRLLAPGGTPIVGARLVVQVQTAIRGASMSDSAQVVTGPDGLFRYVAPAGPSRTVRFAYRSYSGNNSFADTTDVRLVVSAGVTMKAGPTKLRNRTATTFRGTVAGPVPVKGVVVDLQVLFRNKWRTFAAPRTSRKGSYKFKYRFMAGAATWKFRARVRTDSSYPYALGYSKKAVKVRVFRAG